MEKYAKLNKELLMVIGENFQGGQRFSKTQVQEQLLLWTKLSKDEVPPVAHTIGQCLAFCLRKVKDSTSGKKLPEEVLAIGTVKLGEKKNPKKIEIAGKHDDTQHEPDDVKEGCNQEDDGSKHDHVEDEDDHVKDEAALVEVEPSKEEAEPSKEEAEPSKEEAEPSKEEAEPSKEEEGSKPDPNEVLLQWTDVEGKSWKLMGSGKKLQVMKRPASSSLGAAKASKTCKKEKEAEKEEAVPQEQDQEQHEHDKEHDEDKEEDKEEEAAPRTPDAAGGGGAAPEPDTPDSQARELVNMIMGSSAETKVVAESCRIALQHPSKVEEVRLMHVHNN